MNLLLDTNVFIDYLGRKEPYYSDARQIVMAAFFGDVKLWVPAQSVTDAYYVLRKYVDSQALQKVITSAFEFISPVDLVSADLYRAAQLNWRDMEDCLISLAAEKARANYLITRDTKGFTRSSVPAMTPSQWIAFMEQERGLVYGEVALTE